VYETPEALAQLLTFLHLQADQIDRIIINTQDDSFDFLLHDPRLDDEFMLKPTLYHESNKQGVGLMYRIIDVPRLFEQLSDHDFGGQTCRLNVTVHDSFLPENGGSWIVGFENGRVHSLNSHQNSDAVIVDASIELNIAELSSLLMGTINFRQLVAYRQAKISDRHMIDTVDRLFHYPQKPVCMTIF
jgi:predicted acetyltransferase